ncbi:MAG: hypothetical protein HY302_11010 [Opitutae bacterium]|nr:hypothetical protein [Opitutae bacterium]
MKSKITFNKQTLNRWLEGLACVALGIAFGILLLKSSEFQFEWKFNVIDFFGLLLTFAVLFVLQNSVSQRFTDHRVEKDILIAEANKVSARIEKIQQLCRSSANGEDLISLPGLVLSQFKELSVELRSFEMQLVLTPIQLDMKRFAEIQRGCGKTKKLATGGGYPHRAMTLDELSSVQKQIETTRSAIYRMVFYLNRL